MTSLINPAFPVEGNPTTESVRENFGYAKTEIEALQSGKQDTLVSGTTIKTVAGKNVLGPGNLVIDKSDVGLGNVDNTSDASKPVSTAQANAITAAAAGAVTTAETYTDTEFADHIAAPNPHDQYALARYEGNKLVGFKNLDDSDAIIVDPLAELRTDTKTLRGVAHRGGFPLSSQGNQLLGLSMWPVEAGTNYRLLYLGAYAVNETSSRAGSVQNLVECPFGSGNWVSVTFNAVSTGNFITTGSTPDATNNYFMLLSDPIPFTLDEPGMLRVATSAKGGFPCMSNYDGYLDGKCEYEFTLTSSSTNDAAMQLANLGPTKLSTIVDSMANENGSFLLRNCISAAWAGGTLTLGVPAHGASATNNKIVLEGFVNSGVALDGPYSFSTSGADALTVALAVDPGTISQVGIVRLAQSITSGVWSAGEITWTRAAHGFVEGQVIAIRGNTASGSTPNGDFVVTSVPSADTYKVAFPSNPGTIFTTNAYAFSKYIASSTDFHLRPFTILAESDIACLGLAGDSTTQTVDRIQDDTLLCGVLQRCFGERFPFIDLSANTEGLNRWLSAPGTVIIREKLIELYCQGLAMGYSKNDESAYTTIGAWTTGHAQWWARPAQAALASSKFNYAVKVASRSVTSRDNFTSVDAQVKPTSPRLMAFHRFLESLTGTLYQDLIDYAGQITIHNQPYAYDVYLDNMAITFTSTANSAAVVVDPSTPLTPYYNGRLVLLPGTGVGGLDVFAIIRYVSPTKFIARNPVTGRRLPLVLSTTVTGGSGTIGPRRMISPSVSQTDSIHESIEAIARIRDTVALKRPVLA